jgi:hypothetical protein
VSTPPRAVTQNRFQTWASHVAHPQLFDEFDALRRQALAAPAVDQFRSHVCAKRFFEDVVYPSPEGLQRFRQKSIAGWRLDLADNAPAVPADIAAVLQPLLA